MSSIYETMSANLRADLAFAQDLVVAVAEVQRRHGRDGRAHGDGHAVWDSNLDAVEALGAKAAFDMAASRRLFDACDAETLPDWELALEDGICMPADLPRHRFVDGFRRMAGAFTMAPGDGPAANVLRMDGHDETLEDARSYPEQFPAGAPDRIARQLRELDLAPSWAMPLAIHLAHLARVRIADARTAGADPAGLVMPLLGRLERDRYAVFPAGLAGGDKPEEVSGIAAAAGTLLALLAKDLRGGRLRDGEESKIAADDLIAGLTLAVWAVADAITEDADSRARLFARIVDASAEAASALPKAYADAHKGA